MRFKRTEWIKRAGLLRVIVCMSAVFLIVIIGCFTPALADRSSQLYQNYDNYTFYNLDSEHEIEQDFYPSFNYLEAVSLFLVNVEPQMREIELTISDDRGKVIFRKKYPTSSLESGYFSKLTIGKHLKPDQNYTLGLRYEGEDENVLSVMLSPSHMNLPITGQCRYAGETAAENLALCYEYRNMPSFKWMIPAIASVVILCLFVWPAKRER